MLQALFKLHARTRDEPPELGSPHAMGRHLAGITLCIYELIIVLPPQAVNTWLRVLTCLLVWSPQRTTGSWSKGGKGEMDWIEGRATSAHSSIYTQLF